MDAMVDFTGGCPESFCLAELRGAGRDLFSALLDSYAHNSLICCSITGGSGGCETKKSNGLVTGHAYSVTKVVRAAGQEFVRVRNPWGNEVEWRGRWADGGAEWAGLGAADREQLETGERGDGEWCMEWQDFLENFDEVVDILARIFLYTV